VTEQEQLRVLTVCRHAANSWARGNNDLAAKWMDVDVDVIGTDQFLDLETEADR
jgi:hypothetical protein